MKNKKIIIIVLIIFLICLLLALTGVTFSYFQNTGTMTNSFQAGDYSTSATETFVSPSNWLPGDETEKTIIVKNEGTIPMAVRVSFTESWKDSNNQSLPLATDGVKSVIINFDNTDEWFRDGDYYYYDGVLNANEEASSPIKSVTFNKDIVSVPTCITTNGITTCENTYNGYEDATYTLTVKIETMQVEGSDVWNSDEGTIYEVLKNEYKENTGYVGLYSSTHKDSYDREATKRIFYYTTPTTSTADGNVLLDKMNVLFAGYCWQILRTTDTGGIKMIYNGVPVDGKCLNTRGNVNGLIFNSDSSTNMNDTYAFSDDFNYNLTTGKFTLAGTIITTNYVTDKSVLGMFTCKSSDPALECDTLYYLMGPGNNNTSCSMSPITIGSTNYASIGSSTYTRYYSVPSSAGYMYNKSYRYNTISDSTTINNFGSSATWDGTKYTLNNVITTPSQSEPDINDISTHHYFCENNTLQCTTVGFIQYYNGTGLLRYIKLENGVKSVEEALNIMLYASDVNKTETNLKILGDLWYHKNLLAYDSLLEETIYCNNRNISDFGGWSPNGMTDQALKFNDYYNNTNIYCSNETDQFSVSNNKAKLKYKIGFPSLPEMILINNNTARKTNDYYWVLSPYKFLNFRLEFRTVSTNGDVTTQHVEYDARVRPVISLKPGTLLSSGIGTMANPYIIDTSGI